MPGVNPGRVPDKIPDNRHDLMKFTISVFHDLFTPDREIPHTFFML